MIRKLIISNGHTEREVLLVGNIVVGRDPACHLSEPDPLLSRRHAEILSSVNGVSVRDLDSRNGVLVNGEKTREQMLFAGDVVQMGHLHIRYLEEEPQQGDDYTRHGIDRRAPEAPPPPLSFDRFREPTPRRWRPEPTPLPDRRKSEQSPPRMQNLTPVPRGRAAFDGQRPVVGGQRAGDVPVRPPTPGLVAKREPRPGEGLDATVLGGPSELNTIRDAGRLEGDGEPIKAPGDATFAAAVAHLAGLAGEVPAPVQGAEATLTVSADLTVLEASPDCAEMLGVAGESLIGDSLTDVFLRGVRRSYSTNGATFGLRITRGPNGVIVAALTMSRSAETP